MLQHSSKGQPTGAYLLILIYFRYFKRPHRGSCFCNVLWDIQGQRHAVFFLHFIELRLRVLFLYAFVSIGGVRFYFSLENLIFVDQWDIGVGRTN